MRAPARLGAMQARAESLMTDTCWIRRQTGKSDPDPDTGKITPIYTDVYGTEAAPGKCRVKHSSAGATGVSDRTVGEQYVQMVHPVLQVPVSALGIQDGDEVIMITSADPNLVGATLNVSGFADGTQQVMRRYRLQAAT